MADKNTSQKPKAIIVSGGARGIGRVLSRYFLERGHRVFILDIDEEELSYTVNTHLKQHHPRVSYTTCDLGNIDEIKPSVQKAVEFLGGRIDVLINNGGIAHPYWKDGKTIADPEVIPEWQAYVSVNLTAPFVLSSNCLPYMRAPSPEEAEKQALHSEGAGPCIIHVGSFRAELSDPNQEGYASTKSGLLGLTHAMAVSCKPFGVRVNLIAPGRIRMHHECREGDEKGTKWIDTVEKDDLDLHAANRPGKAEDIAKAAEFFIESGFITAQSITVDGGVTKTKNQA